MDNIKIGISACLLGEKVRYNGGHKLDNYLTNILGKYFKYIPVCPEVGCGFGVPREPIRLVGNPEAPRLLTQNGQKDYTYAMEQYCRGKIQELAQEELCGFVFKKDSPSCGLYRVKVYNGKETSVKLGQGIFANAVKNAFPYLPVEEEGRLNDPILRENFIIKVYSYYRWKEFLNTSPSLGGLVAFHTAHKLLIMAHSVTHYRELGRLIAQGKEIAIDQLLERYESLFFAGLSLIATVKKNANVLYHIMGYFKKQLSADEKAELVEVIEDYRQGYLPLIVPITLLKHYVRKYSQEYLLGQIYLNPHPSELMLRNHV